MTESSRTRRRNNTTIHISAITIQLKARRPLRSVSLRINDDRKQLSWEHTSQDAFKMTFNPSLDISASDNLNLELHSSFAQIGTSSISGKDRLVSISAEQLLDGHANGGNRQEWKRTFDKAEVTILLSHGATSTGSVILPGPIASTSSNQGDNAQLVPTTEDILRICPRFRILLIGKTGVGKSSLINKAFGVNDALVSDSAPGQAEIEREIASITNPRFVLHDSQGFEPGETKNFNAVRSFILSRDGKPDLKDKLHAIWVCMATPAAGGRIVETGVEELFQLKNNRELGNVPMIAVFTKFDDLVAREEMNLESTNNDLSDEEISKLARENANKAFGDECVTPFLSDSKIQIPYKVVSTKQGYETTLTDLIQITFEHVQRHVSPEASVITAIAQKPNPTVKIEGCITVGKLRYWRSLASSVSFPGKTLKECLEVIHEDIIRVWNLDDPNLNLRSKEFKALMSNLVEKSVQGKAPSSPNKGLSASIPILAAIAGIVGGLAGPAAPIVIPIAGAFVLAKWAYDVYRASRSNLEHLMAYIIDLTLVMQIIFWIVNAAEKECPTTPRLIKLASMAYAESPIKGKVHVMIGEHVKQTKPFIPGGPDVTLEAIESIIRKCTIKPEEMIKQKPSVDPGEKEESWDTQ